MTNAEAMDWGVEHIQQSIAIHFAHEVVPLIEYTSNVVYHDGYRFVFEKCPTCGQLVQLMSIQKQNSRWRRKR